MMERLDEMLCFLSHLKTFINTSSVLSLKYAPSVDELELIIYLNNFKII